MSSNKLVFAVLCVVLIGASSIEANPLDSKEDILRKQQQQQQQPLAKATISDDERLPIGPDGSLFLAGNECGPDERLAPGSVPTCEPTCANPDPVCMKIFYSSIDYVPCFCKAPLVRNEQTKQCVPKNECPPRTNAPGQQRW